MPFDLPIAITGLGAVSGFGRGLHRLAAGLAAGHAIARPVRAFGTEGFSARIAVEVPESVEFDADRPRCEALALAAAREARAAAAIGDRGRVAVIVGSSAGSIAGVERFRRAALTGSEPADPGWLATVGLGDLTDAIAADLGLRGPRFAVSTACSSGAMAIAAAADLVARGAVDAAVAGGAEALSEYVFAGFHSLGALSPTGCRPFARDRDGLVLGEGAAMVVLERADRATTRGAEPLAYLLGYGLTCDSSHITAPEAMGREAARAMRQALADAGIAPGEVDHVDAHGTATVRGDPSEVRGIAALFAGRKVTVSALKSMLGHTLGAAGALGLAASVLQLKEGLVFPTVGLAEVDPECRADHVRGAARAARLGVVVSNSFAFGGNNISLVIGAPDRG